MFLMGFLMKGLDKIDEQRDQAIDAMIQRTIVYGLDGKGTPGKASWATVYESLRNTNAEEGTTKRKETNGKTARP